MTSVVRMCGADAEAVGRELQARLSRTGEASLELERAADPVALVGLVLAGTQTAKTLWDWWMSVRGKRVSVTLVVDDGRVVELDGLQRSDLEDLLKDRS